MNELKAIEKAVGAEVKQELRDESKHLWLEIAGWYGVIATLVAYFFVSYGIFGPETLTYQILNLTGGIGLVAIATYKKDGQLVIVNVVWALIAVLALVGILMQHR